MLIFWNCVERSWEDIIELLDKMLSSMTKHFEHVISEPSSRSRTTKELLYDLLIWIEIGKRN